MAASVWILENSYIVYEGLRHILFGLGDFKIEPHFESFSGIENYAKIKKCDLLLCNSSLIPGKPSITKLKIRNPRLRVLVIDDGKGEYKNYLNPSTVDGYITLSCQMKEVLTAITSVSHGKKFFCNAHISKTLIKSTKPHVSKSVFLSERERQILKLIANGFSSKEISKELFVSFHTITTHRKNICKKLKVNKVSDVIASAYRLNIV